MKRLSLSQRRAMTGLLFVSPFAVGFAVFYLRSLAQSVHLSLSHVNMLPQGGYETVFAGLEYYRYAFTAHGTFSQVLTSSVMNMLLDVPLIIFFSLFMAMLLNQKFRGRTLVRAIFFLPVILNSQAIAGTINIARAMMMGGVSPASAEITEAAASGSMNLMYYVDLLGEIVLPVAVLEYIVGAIARINGIVTASGVQIIIFLAALQAIAPSLYEVAKIEGATPYESFWKITFPMVSPLIVTNLVYTVVDSYVNSEVLQLSYDQIFRAKDYAMGTVFGLVSMAAVCLVLLIAGGLISKKAYYQN